MGLSRSTYYDKPSLRADDAAVLAAMIAICDEFEAYGYRRVGAELRHRDATSTNSAIGHWRFSAPHRHGLGRLSSENTPIWRNLR